jgi:hypothetical protein
MVITSGEYLTSLYQFQSPHNQNNLSKTILKMKIAKLLSLLLAVIFLSCSEDEDPMPTSAGMVGEWSMTGLEYKGTTTTSFEGTNLIADFTGVAKNIDFTTMFTENPNNVSSAGAYTIVLTTTMMGQTSTDEYTMDEVVSDGTWSLNGKTLSITSDTETESATIVEQTATKLKIKVEVDETESDQGLTVTTKVQATYTFTK